MGSVHERQGMQHVRRAIGRLEDASANMQIS